MQDDLTADRARRRAVGDFVSGALEGDVEKMVGSFDILDACRGWDSAMRAVSKVGIVPGKTRDAFLQIFLQCGASLRGRCDRETVLIDGLRVLLPRYDGPGLRLYRGECFRNRRRRTYGTSWSSSVEVARSFAEKSLYRFATGGSVLLETFAPPDAIICAIALIDDRYAECEYVVDRRHLKRVVVLDHFPQKTQSGAQN